MNKSSLILATTLAFTQMPHMLAADIHAVSDLSHNFTFYADGRFARQYLSAHKTASNWGDLDLIDNKNINLIALLDCERRVKYTPKDYSYISKFLNEGGTVLLAATPGDNGQNNFLKQFGAFYSADAKLPLQAQPALLELAKITSPGEITAKKAGKLTFAADTGWRVLVKDSEGQPVMAVSKIGKGQLIAIPRQMIGSRNDGKDNINSAIITPLLENLCESKPIDKKQPMPKLSYTKMGNMQQIGGVEFHYPTSLAPYFDAMKNISLKCLPLIEKRMGVPLSNGMGGKVGLLATDGGGFSSGPFVGLAVFWEDFPNKQHGMIEFLTHEFTHSWVLPHPEVQNEPIATYVGNLVMQDAGFAEEGKKRIEGTIKRATRVNPDLLAYDLAGNALKAGLPELTPAQKNEIHWGKSFWIYEELAKIQPDYIARYFKTKRAIVPAKLPARYGIADFVAVSSVALGKDMFEWFKAHGVPADEQKVQFEWKSKLGAAVSSR